MVPGILGAALSRSQETLEPLIRSSPELEELERRYQREAFRGLSYRQALRRFESLWAEARQLNPDWREHWLEDIAPDLAIARAVNGLPPDA